MVYHNIREDLKKKGILFTDIETAVREHSDIVNRFFGTVVPPDDNKFAALNSAVWSGGSFVNVPPNVHVEIPLRPTSYQQSGIRQSSDAHHRDEGSIRALHRRVHGSRFFEGQPAHGGDRNHRPAALAHPVLHRAELA
jgi:hypothetical protein